LRSAVATVPMWRLLLPSTKGEKMYDNTNTGALFRNERKTKDTHPEYSGTINVEGKEYWLSAWVKESKAGQKFFSMTVKPKEKNES